MGLRRSLRGSMFGVIECLGLKVSGLGCRNALCLDVSRGLLAAEASRPFS